MLGALVFFVALQPAPAPQPERGIAEPQEPTPAAAPVQQPGTPTDRPEPEAPQPATPEPQAPPPASPPPEPTANDPFGAPPPAVAPAPQTPRSDPFSGVSPSGADPGLLRDYVKVKRPRGNGTWMFAIAGASYGVGALIQVVDASRFRNASGGALERLFFAPTIVLSAVGADARARHDAYYDAALDQPPKKTRGWLAAGITLSVLGAGAGIANEVMWWKCSIGDEGPYHTGGMSEFDDFGAGRRRPCNYDVGRSVLDVSVASLSAGLGMMIWSLRYRHDAKAYENARLVFSPSFSETFRGLTVGGRF